MGDPRTAEDWGRIAVSLPGWRWIPGLLDLAGWRILRTSSTSGPPYLMACEWHETDLNGDPQNIGETMWIFALLWGPDPDDPATAGCLLALFGPGCRLWQNCEDGLWTVEVGGVRASMHATPGRACIAAAEALGRWPNDGRMVAE